MMNVFHNIFLEIRFTICIIHRWKVKDFRKNHILYIKLYELSRVKESRVSEKQKIETFKDLF